MKCYVFVVYPSCISTLSLPLHVVKLWFADASETPRDFIQKRPDPGDWERSQSDSQDQAGQDYTTTITTTTPWSNENQADQLENYADGYTNHEDEENKNKDGSTDYNSGYSYNYDDGNDNDGYNDKYSTLDIKENLPDEDDEGERERNNFGTRGAAIPDLPVEEDDGGDDGVMKSLRDFIRGNHWNKYTKWNSLCNLTTIFALFVCFPFCVWLFEWMFLLINYSYFRVCS